MHLAHPWQERAARHNTCISHNCTNGYWECDRKSEVLVKDRGRCTRACEELCCRNKGTVNVSMQAFSTLLCQPFHQSGQATLPCSWCALVSRAFSTLVSQPFHQSGQDLLPCS